MKLLGRDIPARELIARIEERLRTRGLPTSEEVELPTEGVEPRVEPLTFNLHALEEYADATRALPLHTHRGGVGQVVLLAKWAFRKSCQVFINEALGRQRVFNGHVRDSYAQLSAEVLRLRREVEALRARPVPAVSDAVVPQQERAQRREHEAAPSAVAQPSTAPAPVIDTVLPKPRDTKAHSRPPARPKQPVSAASTEVDATSAPRAPAAGEPVTSKTARAKKAAPSAPAQPSAESSPRRSASGQKKRRNKKSR
ncbi:conserved domain protein [Myxococcus xanthus DK 1622]|uniref:Conserved domain protein n=1 Tax=Myxococcus xanthus (strain DK1622) TaxID=246197 RepID=Q1D1I9_MYXXD|nr:MULTISPECIES: hypothetical protein [Myxococcus]ABF91876.1 conserved domain protein [Myxococcus xanthus DK 1622]NOJ54728.1 hypothetical protein [Myxococcus xanthus]QPM77806.1 hypothetical protein I5Q59_26360 [Myxococcus xanthus]QVW66874.1 hypothetical protein JTM82_31710 [Myxococcus xanthus DZ2]QZZ52990.1 hypothetical protein MyxoNM_27630 [Myxococcus xanthus]